jgi:hypothetical protein
MRRLIATLAFALAATPALAQEITVQAADSIQTVLAARKGQAVTLRLSGGQEIGGKVKDVTPRLVVLGAVTGREFFDAAVAIEKIDAVLVRAK